MQVLPSRAVVRPERSAVIGGTVVGGSLVACGFILAWLAFATPLMSGFLPSGPRPNPVQMVIGGLVWGMALVMPAAVATVGLIRLVRVYAAASAKPKPTIVSKAAAGLGADHVLASRLWLPDGRPLQNLVLGPFGLAVVNELPPPRATRHNGNAWEILRPNGRWAPYENPLDRASRDTERVRRWITAEERDFVVKVYAAIVTTDPTVARTSACAVIGPNEVAAWLQGLPPQRSITPERHLDLVARLQEVA
jgi:hypothetical protein